MNFGAERKLLTTSRWPRTPVFLSVVTLPCSLRVTAKAAAAPLFKTDTHDVDAHYPFLCHKQTSIQPYNKRESEGNYWTSGNEEKSTACSSK